MTSLGYSVCLRITMLLHLAPLCQIGAAIHFNQTSWLQKETKHGLKRKKDSVPLSSVNITISQKTEGEVRGCVHPCSVTGEHVVLRTLTLMGTAGAPGKGRRNCVRVLRE